MFDIGFGQLLLIMVVGLVVLGPQKLPVAIRMVAGWIRVLRTLSTTVQVEISKELKLQELQDSLNKAEKAGLHNLTPELKTSMEELRKTAELMQKSYRDGLQVHQTTTTSDTSINEGNMSVDKPSDNPKQLSVKSDAVAVESDIVSSLIKEQVKEQHNE